MSVKPLFIEFKNSTYAYYVYGSGNKVLLCLHGYGLTGNAFAFLENFLGEEYTLYAIDFPFHGHTDFKEQLLLQPTHLLELIWRIIGKPLPISILAYSMGGRVALELVKHIPLFIEKMVLIAPDGLHKNKWQWFATHTWVGNKLFKYTMQNPVWIFGLLKIATYTTLLNKSIVKFTHYYIDDGKERNILYKRWTTMRLFKPNLKTVHKIINQYAIPTTLVFGAFDRIIVAKRGVAFKKNSATITIETVNAGHALLQVKYAELIEAYFINK